MDETTPSGSAADTADPVSRYLSACGMTVEVAYLGESHIELGRRVRWRALDLVYRYGDGRLLICKLAADGEGAGLTGALRCLVSLIHGIARAVPEVNAVVGHLYVDELDAGSTGNASARLVDLYRRLGAELVPDDNVFSDRVTMIYRLR